MTILLFQCAGQQSGPTDQILDAKTDTKKTGWSWLFWTNIYAFFPKKVHIMIAGMRRCVLTKI